MDTRNAGIRSVAGVWLFVDVHSGKDYSHSAIPFWNGLVRLGFFLIISRVLTQRKEAEAKADLSLRELEASNRKISILGETGDLLQACSLEEEAHEILRSAIPRIFPGSCGVLYSINSSRDLMESVLQWGNHQGMRIAHPQDCWSLRSGKTYFIQSPQTEVKCRHLSISLSDRSICIPMLAHGETFGVMNLQSLKLGDADWQICTAIADQAALACPI